MEFVFPSVWRMSSEYSTKQHNSALLCTKQMSKIWCKNIRTFTRRRDYRVWYFLVYPVLQKLETLGYIFAADTVGLCSF